MARSGSKRKSTGSNPPFKRPRQVIPDFVTARDLMSLQKGHLRVGGNYGRYNTSESETKWFDTTDPSTIVPIGGVVLAPSLNLIPEGTTESSRLGRKARVVSIHIKGAILLPGTANSTAALDRVRFIVLVDKQANGAAPIVTDYLETAQINSFRNLSNSQRFTSLYDKTRVLHSNAGAGADAATDIYPPMVSTLTINKKLNLPLEFSSTTGAITEIRSNNIVVMALSEFGFALSAFTARIRFQG